MERAEMRTRFERAPVARLATLTPAGAPHVVPICFAVLGGEIVSVVDAKPKSTQLLQRLTNVRAYPAASVLVDHYDEDWRHLWWVRVDGRARVVDAGLDRERAVAALGEKYTQYRADPPSGPALFVTPERWRAWSAAPDA